MLLQVHTNCYLCLFIAYLPTLLVAQTEQCQVMLWLMSNELETMWNEAVMVRF